MGTGFETIFANYPELVRRTQEAVWDFWEEKMALTEVTLDNVEDVFTYHAPTTEQVDRMKDVRDQLVAAAQIILTVAPRCPARTRAINALVDARMLANNAIMLEHLH